jgi:hypothetical protein
VRPRQPGDEREARRDDEVRRQRQTQPTGERDDGEDGIVVLDPGGEAAGVVHGWQQRLPWPRGPQHGCARCAEREQGHGAPELAGGRRWSGAVHG